jgi:hypothetical protein
MLRHRDPARAADAASARRAPNLAKVCVVVEDVGVCWATAGHKTGAAGPTHGLLAIRVVEDQRTGGELVDGWGQHALLPIGAQELWAQVVD